MTIKYNTYNWTISIAILALVAAGCGRSPDGDFFGRSPLSDWRSERFVKVGVVLTFPTRSYDVRRDVSAVNLRLHPARGSFARIGDAIVAIEIDLERVSRARYEEMRAAAVAMEASSSTAAERNYWRWEVGWHENVESF